MQRLGAVAATRAVRGAPHRQLRVYSSPSSLVAIPCAPGASPIVPPRTLPSAVSVRSFAAVSAAFRPPSLPLAGHLTNALRYSSIPSVSPLLKPSALRLSSLHRQLPRLPLLSLSASIPLKGALFPSSSSSLLAKALNARSGDYNIVGSQTPLSEEQRQHAVKAIAGLLLILLGAALWIVTTDEETLAQELIRPAFATHVLAEEDEESIYVTDAGTEGEDPDEVIQITSKGKVDIKGWRWIVKKLHKFIMQSLRALTLAFYFAPVLLTLPLYKFFPSFHNRWWALLVTAIENSGAAFVKFGQWAASRSDLFSPDVCERLGKLRNRAPTHAFSITKKLFTDEFGEPLEEIFSEFPDEPIASGSIAQVYKAKLKDSGETVAVKVRHPWVVDQIQFDLLLIYWMTKQITRLPAFNWMELPVSVRDFAHHLSQQVDLTLEARNLLRFLQNFAGISNVHFPRPIEPYVSPSILVESFEEGVPITQYTTTPSPINPRLARMGFTAFLKMLLVDNFVHADCHSDNILVRLDKKNRPEIVMLDVGIVTQLMPYDKECIVSLMKILYDRDPNRAADTMVRLSKKQKVDAVVSVPQFRADLHRVFSHIFSLPEAEAGVSRTMTSVFSVMRNHHIKMESNLALLAVSMAVLEGLARKLDPNIDLLPVAFPYLFGNFPFGRALAQLSEGMIFDRR